MKKFLIIIFAFFKLHSIYNFAVIGGGPAGISVIGVLLDLGIPSDNIIWIDDKFNAGDISNYPNIPANTKNKHFIDFLCRCRTFKDISCESFNRLYCLDPEKEYPLSTIIEPLTVITDNLLSRLPFKKGNLNALFFKDDFWNMKVDDQEIIASHVILATGSHPKKMNLNSFNLQEISLVDALDKNRLKNIVQKDDNVAVIGNAHSAVLILKNLHELNVNRIYSFYRGTLKYTQDMGGWFLNSHSGLKGVAAEWAKQFLETNSIENLIRIESSDLNLEKYLPLCNKVIQAWGFQKNAINCDQDISNYDNKTGLIAPRLFGIGIAFPEKYIDPFGNTEYRVGVNSFMEYAQKMVPIWAKMKNLNLNYDLNYLDKLFEIYIL